MSELDTQSKLRFLSLVLLVLLLVVSQLPCASRSGVTTYAQRINDCPDALKNLILRSHDVLLFPSVTHTYLLHEHTPRNVRKLAVMYFATTLGGSSEARTHEKGEDRWEPGNINFAGGEITRRDCAMLEGKEI